MNQKLTLDQILLAFGMLLTGSINLLVIKSQYQTTSTGLDGKKTLFNHAGIVTFTMFAGEALCLLGFCCSSRKTEMSNKQQVVHDQDSSGFIKQNQKTNRLLRLIFILPAACDVIGSTLSVIALIYLDASVAQMLRGSIIVFTGIFSKIFLKHKLKPSHWFGMVVTVTGLCLVGLASVLKQDKSGNKNVENVVLGIFLTIISQIAGATQMVLEETFLKGKGFKPFYVVGMEGVYGLFLMSFVLVGMRFLPKPTASFDNTYDALVMIKNNPVLIALTLVCLLSILFFNFFGMSVTRSLTAVHRTFLDACRSVIVWLCSIIIYYSTNQKYGEKFDDKWGLLQIDGFLLLIIGTAIYYQLFDFSWLPCIKRTEYKIHHNEEHRKVVTDNYEKRNAADNEINEHEEISPIYHGFLDD
ncbi:solute carrier family 35 member F6 [Hydra vulgaris]|uniref:solute carrier family 35 member F6 n=1 Tax=Hydra vulgaris TaxID=6087 RepID=UPI001F5EB75A|nr:solute carrier family 35 member F6-like [Hydra vulgaris]